MVKRRGRYFLFYSIANYTNDSYGVSVAVSRRNANTPTGRFVKFRGNPIYSGRRDKHFCGVGHQDVMELPNDTWILFAHAYLKERPSNGGRRRCVFSKRRRLVADRRQLVADRLRWNRRRKGFAWPSVKTGTPSGNGEARGTLTPFPK